MKKLITVIASIILLTGSVFAGDFVDDGDVQLQAGFSRTRIKVEDMEKSIPANEAVLGIEGWGLFKPVDAFGFGVVFNVGGSAGLADRMELETPAGTLKGDKSGLSCSVNVGIGPAIAVYLGEAVRLGTNFCFTCGYRYDVPLVYNNNGFRYGTSIDTRYGGFSTGLQAKFLPSQRFSPIVGWKFTKGFSTNIQIETESSNDAYDKKEHVSSKYRFTQNIFYVGLGISLN